MYIEHASSLLAIQRNVYVKPNKKHVRPQPWDQRQQSESPVDIRHPHEPSSRHFTFQFIQCVQRMLPRARRLIEARLCVVPKRPILSGVVWLLNGPQRKNDSLRHRQVFELADFEGAKLKSAARFDSARNCNRHSLFVVIRSRVIPAIDP